MEEFFGKGILLHGETAAKLYGSVKDLPIIDYHCHLDAREIADDRSFSDLGELWLKHDHYKWRAMRLNGVDERYITGEASDREKFMKYAEIMPALIGNPLYYWTHMELKQIFGISQPLNPFTAEKIYAEANEKLKNMSVRSFLKKFNVEFIATTDDPIDELNAHGRYATTAVTPTFRPDKLYDFSEEYLGKLAAAAHVTIRSWEDVLKALQIRLDYFVSKGCRMSDHGFEKFPKAYASEREAAALFARRQELTDEEREKLFGALLMWLTKEYKKRDIAMQLHFAVIRDNHREMFPVCGKDAGFDLIGEPQSVKDLVAYFDRVSDNERPETILYTLNDENLRSIAAVTGAFRHVRMGAAWWFNDTLQGIKRNLETIGEYSALGNNLGMLTDSRSFSSYCRFDFFRRILCDHVGDKTERGEYDLSSAQTLVKNICYDNAKRMVFHE